MTQIQIKQNIKNLEWDLKELTSKIDQAKKDIKATYAKVQDFAKADAVQTDKAIKRISSLNGEVDKLNTKVARTKRQIELLTTQIK